MQEPLDLQHNEEFLAELRDSAKHLIDKLQQPDFEGASLLINQILAARDRKIFTSVGQLTRGLHSALVNFHIDAELQQSADQDVSQISDATDRLNYVVSQTQLAADKTMDLVEKAMPVSSQIGSEASQLKAQWAKLKNREMTADEFRSFYPQMEAFLNATEQGSSELGTLFQDILLAQDFQDLTGQVIQRVIGLVKDVENELVTLVKLASQVETVTGTLSELVGEEAEASESEEKKYSSKGEGPQIHADKQENVVSSQDDVDDLLSSLGF